MTAAHAKPAPRVPLPLWARIVFALVAALLVQAVLSALVLHWLYFVDPQQAAMRRAAFHLFLQANGVKPAPWRHVLLSPLGTTLTSAALVAAVAVPLTWRLTQRVQRLHRAVQALGNLDLGTRVEMQGRDEVAALAAAFNQAAEHIETLVQSHKSLLAYTSHELRTPLTRLRLGLEAIDRDPGASTAALEGARRDLAELDQLIGAILLFSRLDAGGRRAIDRQEVDVLALAAEEAARDGIDVQGDWVRLQGDERLLRHVIRNLLDNARKHAPGSRPTIEVQAIAGGASIRVCDHGPGVPTADTERIFEPFVRLGPRGDGSGLGLALVRRIAQLHGGNARCTPNPGGGACFIVDIMNQASTPAGP